MLSGRVKLSHVKNLLETIVRLGLLGVKSMFLAPLMFLRFDVDGHNHIMIIVYRRNIITEGRSNRMENWSVTMVCVKVNI